MTALQQYEIADYAVGEWVEYYSETHETRWIRACVESVRYDTEGKISGYKLDVKKNAKKEKIRKATYAVPTTNNIVYAGAVPPQITTSFNLIPEGSDPTLEPEQNKRTTGSQFGSSTEERTPSQAGIQPSRTVDRVTILQDAQQQQHLQSMMQNSNHAEQLAADSLPSIVEKDADGVDKEWKLNEVISYWSRNFDRWMPAKIIRLYQDRASNKIDLDIKRSAKWKNIKKHADPTSTIYFPGGASNQHSPTEHLLSTNATNVTTSSPTSFTQSNYPVYRASAGGVYNPSSIAKTSLVSSSNITTTRTIINNHASTTTSSSHAAPASRTVREVRTSTYDSQLTARTDHSQNNLQTPQKESVQSPPISSPPIANLTTPRSAGGENGASQPRLLATRVTTYTADGVPIQEYHQNLATSQEMEEIKEMDTVSNKDGSFGKELKQGSQHVNNSATKTTTTNNHAAATGSTPTTTSNNATTTPAVVVNNNDPNSQKKKRTGPVLTTQAIGQPRRSVPGTPNGLIFNSLAVPQMGFSNTSPIPYNKRASPMKPRDSVVKYDVPKISIPNTFEQLPSDENTAKELFTAFDLPVSCAIRRMDGFQGGLNEGIYIISGAELDSERIVKAVKSKRTLEQVPSEGESIAILQQSSIGNLLQNDITVAFPLKWIQVTQGVGEQLDVFLMKKATGKRFSDWLADWWHNDRKDYLGLKMKEFGSFLKKFHRKYSQNMNNPHREHGDMQPSNVMYDDEQNKFVLIDIAGMAYQTAESDLQHFTKALRILGQSYGDEFVRRSQAHFDTGYRMAF